MCTVVVAAQVFAEHPLVVIANRDEDLDRASSPPHLWTASTTASEHGSGGPFVAPRDDVAGGTWLGVNRAGVFVGITNRYLGPKDPARVSRGTHVAQLTLGRGVHALTERSFGAGDDTRRLAHIRAAWSRLAPSATLDLERLSSLLTEHDEHDLLAATCIHVPGIRYGTRSGAAIALAADPHAGASRSRMLWAEGPPCTTPFVPVDLSALDVPGPVKTV